jgi:hypothetical protein
MNRASAISWMSRILIVTLLTLCIKVPVLVESHVTLLARSLPPHNSARHTRRHILGLFGPGFVTNDYMYRNATNQVKARCSGVLQHRASHRNGNDNVDNSQDPFTRSQKERIKRTRS